MTQGLPQEVGRAVDTVASGTTRVLESLTDVSGEFQSKVLVSAFFVLALILLRRLVLKVVQRRLDEPRLRYRWSRGSGYVATFLTILIVVNVWVEGIRSLGTFLGLLVAGLAIALRDVVADLAGWLFIVWRRPFDLGDRIEIAGHAGDVVDLSFFQLTLLEIGNWVDSDQSTGRIIHVPNLKVFSEPMANYTAQFPYVWNEVPVLVTFDSDWRKAKAVLQEIVEGVVGNVPEEAERAMRDASRKLLIFYQKYTPIVYTSVDDSGVLLAIRYLCDPRHRRGTSQAIWEGVLDAFAAEPDLELAYPTRRLVVDPRGREGAAASAPEAAAAPAEGADPRSSRAEEGVPGRA